MSAKALLDMNNNPSPDQIRKAIKHNICRCTGYVKIEKAIDDGICFISEIQTHCTIKGQRLPFIEICKGRCY
jgi:xanthine dehydrogenase iron-sulfur cluster and FAD-binding subunit A